jgi:hypothetical protein
MVGRYMNNKFEGLWKACFKVVQVYAGMDRANHEHHQSGYLLLKVRFEVGVSRKWGSANHLIAISVAAVVNSH